MKLLLRVWAVTLFASGLPGFLGLAAMFGTLWVIEGWRGLSDEAVGRFVLLYTAFAVSGLLTAAGGMLWAVTRMAYPSANRFTLNQPL